MHRLSRAIPLALALTAGTASAQPAPFNQVGVTMGHWHIISKDVDANKKLFARIRASTSSQIIWPPE